MNLDKLSSLVSRLFFVVAFLLVGIAVLEAVVRFFGFTILRGSYTSGRLLELGAVLMVFVISLLLRQVRQALTK
jgi:hypothetical protein